MLYEVITAIGTKNGIDLEKMLVSDGEEMDKNKYIEQLTEEMKQAAMELQFEKAASLRDKIKELQGIT